MPTMAWSLRMSCETKALVAVVKLLRRGISMYRHVAAVPRRGAAVLAAVIAAGAGRGGTSDVRGRRGHKGFRVGGARPGGARSGAARVRGAAGSGAAAARAGGGAGAALRGGQRAEDGGEGEGGAHLVGLWDGTAGLLLAKNGIESREERATTGGKEKEERLSTGGKNGRGVEAHRATQVGPT